MSGTDAATWWQKLAADIPTFEVIILENLYLKHFK
jgi:hypothetical protein